MAEELMAIVPDKILANMRAMKELPTMARRVIDTEGNLITVNTKGLVELAERLEAAKRVVKAERELKEEMGELVASEEATKVIRDQQRELEGAQRRLAARDKDKRAITAEPAMAVDAKGSR